MVEKGFSIKDKNPVLKSFRLTRRKKSKKPVQNGNIPLQKHYNKNCELIAKIIK